MLLFINTKVENLKADYNIFKYMLLSYANIKFKFKYIYLFVEMPPNYFYLTDLKNYVGKLFGNNAEIILSTKLGIKDQYHDIFLQLREKYGQELVLFLENHKDIFIDFNHEIFDESIQLFKDNYNQYTSIYLSNWPVKIKEIYQYGEPIIEGNFIKFKSINFETPQIFTIDYLCELFDRHNVKIIQLTTYIPLREMVRNFDGYDNNYYKPMQLPYNQFNYNENYLLNKLEFYELPYEIIDINLNLNKHMETYTLPKQNKPHYKAIILILASGGNNTYRNARRVWKQYMKLDPDIKVFFVYGKLNNFLEDYDKNSDLIYEDIPDDGHIFVEKTIKAMKHIDENYTYDFFIRTNISTFWDFGRLHLYLNTLPRYSCYAGFGPLPFDLGKNAYYLRGTDIIVTPDLIKSLIQNSYLANTMVAEDESFGLYFNNVMKAPMIPTKMCIFEDINSINDNEKIINRIYTATINNYYSYRVKNEEGGREQYDILVYKFLLKYIYNIEYNN